MQAAQYVQADRVAAIAGKPAPTMILHAAV